MGEARGERRIDASTSCDDLASGAALAVSMAIDPIAALGHRRQASRKVPSPNRSRRRTEARARADRGGGA